MIRIAIVALTLGASALATPALAASTVAFTSVGGTSLNNAPLAGAFATMTFDAPFNGTANEATQKGLLATISGVEAGRVSNNPQGVNGQGYFVVAPTPYNGTDYFAVGSDGALKLQNTGATPFFSSISVFIGSIDAYNSVDLFDAAGTLISTFSGTQLNNGVVPNFPGSGDPSGSRFVTFNGTNGTLLSGIRFSNTGGNRAFEFDNVSFTTAVPEPATWMMMLVGFGMVGAAARYRRRTTAAAIA